ncbi:MAG TPA: hypothetical protein VGR28_00640, partial [Candidatus Thermoplasmatota archaeon]|nr:hypothetical protein [Candidatus Thermoplasmatota archaeon]
MQNLENLALATGSSGARDLASLLPHKVSRDINRYVEEQAWARKVFAINRDLVGASGLTIKYPLKEKSVAMKLSDMGDILTGQGEWKEKSSEAFLVGARAQWTYATEEARLFDMMAEEMKDAVQAIVEFENKLVYGRCVADVAASNAFEAEARGTFSYADLIKLRKLVQGPMDYVVIHPTQMADILSQEKFLRGDFITTLKPIEPA